MNVDPSKSSVKFDYKEDCKVIKTISLSKFKKDKGQIIDTPLKASLLYSPEAKSFHITIESITTHTNLFSGLILPVKSEFKMLHGKKENLEIRCFKINNSTKKLESFIIKIQTSGEEEEINQVFEIVRQMCEGSFEWKEEKDE